jgi:hypothetical protein
MQFNSSGLVIKNLARRENSKPLTKTERLRPCSEVLSESYSAG